MAKAGTTSRGISAAAAAMIVGAAIGTGAGSAAAAEPIVGRASVIDGDTLDIHGTRVRLYGIDAPESSQTCRRGDGETYRCGADAANALAEHIGAGPVSCEPVEQDRYGRTVAICEKDGEDLCAWMVAQGHALAFRKYSTVYVDEEVAAHQAGRGVWVGAFTPPWEWRREQKAGR